MLFWRKVLIKEIPSCLFINGPISLSHNPAEPTEEQRMISGLNKEICLQLLKDVGIIIVNYKQISRETGEKNSI